jgi:hypothetical protein
MRASCIVAAHIGVSFPGLAFDHAAYPKQAPTLAYKHLLLTILDANAYLSDGSKQVRHCSQSHHILPSTLSTLSRQVPGSAACHACDMVLNHMAYCCYWLKYSAAACIVHGS